MEEAAPGVGVQKSIEEPVECNRLQPPSFHCLHLSGVGTVVLVLPPYLERRLVDDPTSLRHCPIEFKFYFPAEKNEK